MEEDGEDEEDGVVGGEEVPGVFGDEGFGGGEEGFEVGAAVVGVFGEEGEGFRLEKLSSQCRKDCWARSAAGRWVDSSYRFLRRGGRARSFVMLGAPEMMGRV